MSIDKAVKDYKARVKESDFTLKELEARAAEIASMDDARRDAENDFEDAQSKLGNVASDKDTIKDELSEAVLTGGDVAGLRERYADLTVEEDRLRERIGDATKAVEENTPDSGEVTALKARLHNFRASGADELQRTVKELVQADTDAMKARSEAAQELLPDVDSLTLLGALVEHTEAYKSLYAGHRQTIQHEENISPAAGQKARERLDYAVGRILARA